MQQKCCIADAYAKYCFNNHLVNAFVRCVWRSVGGGCVCAHVHYQNLVAVVAMQAAIGSRLGAGAYPCIAERTTKINIKRVEEDLQWQ